MKDALISQYKASLKMLVDVTERCPAGLWADASYENPYWRIVYHALFYTALYLSESEDKFVPWTKHIHGYNGLGLMSHHNKPILIKQAYSSAEMLGYAASIIKSIEDAVNTTVAGQPSGFDWLPLTKIELHLYNIRHLQHHAGQLTERLRQHGITGIKWVRNG